MIDMSRIIFSIYERFISSAKRHDPDIDVIIDNLDDLNDVSNKLAVYLRVLVTSSTPSSLGRDNFAVSTTGIVNVVIKDVPGRGRYDSLQLMNTISNDLSNSVIDLPGSQIRIGLLTAPGFSNINSTAVTTVNITYTISSTFVRNSS